MKKRSLLILPVLFMLNGCKEKFVYSFAETEKAKMYYNLSYGKAERNVLDLVVPKRNAHKGLILYIHGGGWVAGEKDGYRDSLISFAVQGYTCAAINYRYAGEHKVTGFDILDDITAALTNVKTVAQESNVDLTSALLTGSSSGAHLSLLYAYSRQEEAPIKPSCVVSYSAPTDLTDPNYYDKNATNYEDRIKIISAVSGKKISADNYTNYSDLLKSLSPTYYVNSNTVQTIVCHGNKDDLIPYSNAVSLDALLTQNNVEHEFVSFENSGHGLENDYEAMQKSYRLFDGLVEKYLK